MEKAKHILLKGSYNDDRNIVEVGIDEAGRGALAGPVTVSAVIMPYGFNHPLIKDSKLLKFVHASKKGTKALISFHRHAIYQAT